ncbi:MAG: MFS transporter [Actinomycetota bacterium]|nr:MFS transporter [Actinomycetota bacterium]MDA8167778.1 MFS transporter [Actinomycetota bacterium]
MSSRAQMSESAEAKRVALFVAALSSFLAPFMISAVNIAIPVIAGRFKASAVQVSWFANAYLLTTSMFLVPFGRIADLYGRKKVFIYGMVVYTSSSLIAAMANSGLMLIAARLVEGTGAAMIVGTGIAILTSIFPPEDRGRVLGINVAAVYLGLSLGPFIGGFMTDFLGWRSVFLLNVPLGSTALAMVIWKLKGEWAGARGESFDIPGAVIYMLMLPALIYGLPNLPEEHLLGAVLVGAGVLGVAAFIWRQSRIEQPLLDVKLFRHNTVFAFSNLAALINYSATFAVGFLLSLYLQFTQGHSAFVAGILLVPQPAVMTILSPFAGRLSDRMEPIIVASVGMALTTLGLFLFIFLGEDTSMLYIVFDLVILGAGFGLFSSPNTNAVMSSVKPRLYGVASGTLGTMRTIGQSMSLGIVTLMFAIYIGSTEFVSGGALTAAAEPLFLKSVRISFVIFTFLCFGGIFASMARGRMREDGTE